MKIALNKICSKCSVDKPIECFGKHSQRKDGLRSQCRACEVARTKAWREANPKKRSAYGKAYREANKDKISAYDKAYYEANREKAAARNRAWYEANKDKIAAYDKAWQEANKDKVAAKDAKRHAAKLKRTPPWLTQEHHDQITSIYAERVRLTQETGVVHHVDHILPLQGKNVCGLHVPWNLRVIPAEDNLRKSNKH